MAAFGNAYLVAPDLPNRIRHGVSVDNPLMQFSAQQDPNDFLQKGPSTKETDAKNYLDWSVADLPEALDTPEVIPLSS